MNNFKFENQGSNTYLVYQVNSEQELDMLTLGMLTNNHIEHFAPLIYAQQDAEIFLKYNVTSKVTVEQLWEDTISKKHLVGVLKGLISAFLNAEEYMLDTNALIFETDKIFVDISTGDTELVCLPVADNQKQVLDMKAFFKEILFAARLNPSENNDYFVRLINFVNNKNAFSMEACKEILDEISDNRQNNVQASVQQSNRTQNVSTERVASNAQSMGMVHNSVHTSPVSQNPVKEPVVSQTSVYNNLQETSVLQNQATQTMAIPGMNNKVVNNVQEEKKTEKIEKSDEKEISWFYLMQHYNKENAALYKEQKARKKQEKENEKAAEKEKKKDKNKKDKKDKKDKKNKNETSSQVTGFAVPGQQTSIPTAQQSVQQQSNVTQVPQHQAQAIQAPQSNLYTANMQYTGGHSQQPSSGITQGRANFGETTILIQAGSGQTTVLSMDMMPGATVKMPYLIRSKNGEKILLDKPVFRIGKERSYVDYFIADNTAISRSHANIIERDGAYYIVDTNSTNHTYVDGMMIPSNQEIMLIDGANIRLANEEFRFLIG